MGEETLSEIEEIKSKIKDLEDGMMEIAREAGKLKGGLDTHKDTPDAHNPSIINKRKLN